MSVFTLPQARKEELLVPQLRELVSSHRERCPPYARILEATRQRPDDINAIADLPWLPVRLFKQQTLRSVPADDVVKVLTSSGTTGDVSRIYLDRDAAAAQNRALAQTLASVLGPARLPMLIVDSRGVVGDRRSYSARGAGMLGMITFGRDHTWALDENGETDVPAIGEFLSRHGDQPFLIFGFTYLVWLFLYQRAAGWDLSNGALIHSGGWKKLADQAVDNSEFRRRFARDTGLTKMHNFYGMVEQIGTIYLESDSGGHLYCPDFADVVIRDPMSFEPLPTGSEGLIEVVSTLPTSYPGNALLTEDLGVVDGIDDGDWPGKRFRVLGRLPRAEARGCSDTFSGEPRG